MFATRYRYAMSKTCFMNAASIFHTKLFASGETGSVPLPGRQLRSKCREELFASEIRRRRVDALRSSRWRWHLDEVFVKVDGETRYLWRAVDHEGEVLEAMVTRRRDRKAALTRRAAKQNCYEN